MAGDRAAGCGPGAASSADSCRHRTFADRDGDLTCRRPDLSHRDPLRARARLRPDVQARPDVGARFHDHTKARTPRADERLDRLERASRRDGWAPGSQTTRPVEPEGQRAPRRASGSPIPKPAIAPTASAIQLASGSASGISATAAAIAAAPIRSPSTSCAAAQFEQVGDRPGADERQRAAVGAQRDRERVGGGGRRQPADPADEEQASAPPAGRGGARAASRTARSRRSRRRRSRCCRR